MKWLILLALMFTAKSASSAPPVYQRLIFGSCQKVSTAGASGFDEDISKRLTPFHCDQVIVSYLDRYQRKIRIKFTDTQHPNEVSSLEYEGILQPDHRHVAVSTFFYQGPPALSVGKDSRCILDFDGKEISGIVCGANYKGGAKYQGVVAFDADPGQSLGDDNEQP